MLSDEENLERILYEEMLWEAQELEVLQKIKSLDSIQDSSEINELDRAQIEEGDSVEEEKQQENRIPQTNNN